MRGELILKKQDTCAPKGTLPKDTGFGYTMSVIGGKYKMTLIHLLAENKVLRHNELHRLIGTISFKTLSVMLKELINDSIVKREEFPQVPPRVEYSLTELGETLIPILYDLCDWGEKNREATTENR